MNVIIVLLLVDLFASAFLISCFLKSESNNKAGALKLLSNDLKLISYRLKEVMDGYKEILSDAQKTKIKRRPIVLKPRVKLVKDKK